MAPRGRNLNPAEEPGKFKGFLNFALAAVPPALSLVKGQGAVEFAQFAGSQFADVVD
jgi:hypothetical protein